MLGVDAGGTFTDVVSVREGRIEVTKVPSSRTDPAAPVVEGARRLGVAGQSVFNHASTMGLNAVITRRLPKIAFLTTDGHRDMLAAGRVWRPLDGQTDASWRRSFGDAGRPLVPRYLRRGITERLLADGSVLVPLDEDQARAQLEVLERCEVEGVAICLINAYINHEHETRLRDLAEEILGDIPISISSEVSPLAKEYARASTTVIDVFMKLMYGGYAEQLDRELTGLGFDGELNFADCAATLMPWEEALKQPFKIVFAGPAAGTVSCRRLGEAMGERNLMCCDVGGTSTDVSLVVDGRPFVQNTFELEHDMIINALSTEVSSVGAGGGSIVSISPSGDVLVGPASAGAEPGPACYGWGGELPTVTDACLLMGILDPDGFASGEVHLDSERARAAFERLETPAVGGPADRVRVPHRGEQHRRGGHEHRDPPRRGSAGLQPPRVRRRRADAAAGGPGAAARQAGRDPPVPRQLLRAGPAQRRPGLLRQPQRVRRAVARGRAADREGLRGHGDRAARPRRRRGRRHHPPQLRRAPVRPELGDAVHRRARAGRSPATRSPG